MVLEQLVLAPSAARLCGRGTRTRAHVRKAAQRPHVREFGVHLYLRPAANRVAARWTAARSRRDAGLWRSRRTLMFPLEQEHTKTVCLEFQTSRGVPDAVESANGSVERRLVD